MDGIGLGVNAVLLSAVIFLCFRLRTERTENARRMAELEERLKQEYSAQVTDRQTRLSALQSQINPHFLYNTLECIRSEAILYDCDSIARMAKALASFFRYSISKKENVVTLREELANIENYFLIQSYRFDDKFSLEIQAEEDERDVYSCLIPKLALQPIVENAIFHGLETRTEDGRVIIRVRTTEDKVVIVISDNGVGIERAELEQMRERLKHPELEKGQREGRGNGIALANVSQRIKLIFGSDYGLNLYSTKGVGTDVELVFPIITDRAML